jgi:hypothetical protein
MLIKYPKTLHLPWSPSVLTEDKILKNTKCFENKRIVITEKMDGENSTLCFERPYARSLDSVNYDYRDWLKALWARIRYDIRGDMRICGEYMYAMHSIPYIDLESYFLVFAIYVGNICLSWEETKTICKSLHLSLVPELYIGRYSEEKVRQFDNIIEKGTSEGYVIRNADRFNSIDFNRNIAKYVRRNHIQTDEHWMSKSITKNKVK